MPQVKPHKHADLIKTWADGAVIQFKNDDGSWIDCNCNAPTWDYRVEYRVKPEPKHDIVYFCTVSLDAYEVFDLDVFEPTLIQHDCDNLKLTLDAETGALKDATVIKK